MAAVGTVLVTGSLREINQTAKLNSFPTCLLTVMGETRLGRSIQLVKQAKKPQIIDWRIKLAAISFKYLFMCAWRIPWTEKPGGLWSMGSHSQTQLSDFHFSLSCIGEGNGNPLQCSCLENPGDRGAWWAAAYGVTQSRTWLKRLSSSRACGKQSNWTVVLLDCVSKASLLDVRLVYLLRV